MNHGTAMAERLPLLYREGELVAQVLDLLANQIAILDEEANDVRRSHSFHDALDLNDAGRLGALLDLPVEDWQTLDVYRAWVDAIRDATLRDGAVTVGALKDFVRRYAAGFQDATELTIVPQLTSPPGRGPDPAWAEAVPSGGTGSTLAFVEFPAGRRFGPDPVGGAGAPIEPLTSFMLTNKGLDPVPVAALIAGLSTGPEYVPVLANVTTGEALVFLDRIPPGARLWLRPGAGGVEASLEGKDVTRRLRSISGFTPGTPWEAAQVGSNPVQPVTLGRGQNQLWFLTVAHYDVPGLSRALFALAGTAMHQGYFDRSAFDQAIFVQAAAVRLEATWVEAQPASIAVHLPGGHLRCPKGRTPEGVAQREALRASIDEGVARLRGAGVASTVSLDPFCEGGPQLDRLVMVEPVVIREVGPTGADRLPDAGGQFDVTRFEDSTFR